MKSDEKKQEKKDETLEKLIKQAEKQFGKGSLMRMGEHLSHLSVETVSTGLISLDYALGVGGFPKGRIVEIYGPEASGKTTLALQAIAQVQKEGGKAAFIDAEHALDPSYADLIGVKLNDILISQPDCGEDALEIADLLIRSGEIDVVVIDSVAALVPRAELEGEMGDISVGSQARLMSKALRKLAGNVTKSKALMIFINQIRMKIGVTFGNPETTTGGTALKFYSSVRLEVRKGESIRKGTEVVGNVVKVKVVKNKVAPPYRTAELYLLFGKGLSRSADLLKMGENVGVVNRMGSWYSFGEVKLGQGFLSAIDFLDHNPEIAEELEGAIRKKLWG